MVQWEDRKRSQAEITAEIRGPLSRIPGALVSLRAPNSLGIRGAGRGLQFAVVGASYKELGQLAQALVDEMNSDPAFANPQLSTETDQPQLELRIARGLAADVGVSPRELVETLRTYIDGDTVTKLFLDDETVDVDLEAGGRPVNDQGDLENIFIAASDGRFVPASVVASLSETVGAATLSREGGRRAVGVEANLGAGVDLGTAADRLAAIAPTVLGNDAQIQLLGEAAALESGQTQTLLVFAAAILIVFLVLSAQFESFASASIIMLTVPFGLGAALLAIYLTGGTINYYSQIGLVILVGIMAKNGILIVEFANQRRAMGESVENAIRAAMSLRLRPVIMTAVSTVWRRNSVDHRHRRRRRGSGGGRLGRCRRARFRDPVHAAAHARALSDHRPVDCAARGTRQATRAGSWRRWRARIRTPAIEIFYQRPSLAPSLTRVRSRARMNEDHSRAR